MPDDLRRSTLPEATSCEHVDRARPDLPGEVERNRIVIRPGAVRPGAIRASADGTGMPAPHAGHAVRSEDPAVALRAGVEAICQQIAAVVDGNFAVRIATESDDHTVQKLGATVSFALDVADRAVRGAERSVARLQAVQRCARIGTFEMHPDGSGLLWSSEMHALFGTDCDGFFPTLGLMLERMTETDRRRFEVLVAEAAAGEGPVTMEWPDRGPSGQIRWLWCELRPEFGPAEPERRSSVERLTGICQDITDQKAAVARISHLAHHDALTGLANRTTLTDRLSLLLRKRGALREPIAVLWLDLDDFKSINDAYGHLVGDAVLKTIAARLRRHTRDEDTIARIGGDEFVIVQPSGPQPKAADRLAHRLLAALAEPVIVPEAGEMVVSGSIGIALSQGAGGDVDELLSRADRALYRVKGLGGNNVALHDPVTDALDTARLTMRQDLVHALARNEFFLVYQPIYAVKHSRVTGFEALLRWRSPRHGAVPPDMFIPLAEQTGLMPRLGEFVLRAACGEAANWQSPLTVSVNVSAVQIRQGNLPAVIAAVLDETGLDPARLELEVTESLLLDNTERVLEALRAVKALGVSIAMDDFGTGYSSLATLRAFPFDKLKVDRSFVKDLCDSGEPFAIINAILGLGRGLKLPVVAEGVETEMQAQILKRCGCDHFQGYLLGRPSPIETFADLLRQRSCTAGPLASGPANPGEREAVSNP